ncbi:hypothetical protein JK358_00965 [Nocardia sp. 2]|uniref:DUF3168 domain-containing protein n=1 Tax=Nocardia acididurans TaxID=2802282 RepID=A0ABS1LYW1_9NOCA|nr:hypothetical protein [Nocardia acididurans]MBL1072960.1 hypothetical protein [Nocardia acididurans]
MPERIVFPDIEAVLVGYLTTELSELADTAQVVTQVPDPRPARLVRIVRDDRSPRLDREDREGRRGSLLILDRPRVRLECSDDTGDAAGLAGLVRAILAGAAPGYLGAVWCDGIADAGLENDTDPATCTPRQVITADLFVRGTVLA